MCSMKVNQSMLYSSTKLSICTKVVYITPNNEIELQECFFVLEKTLLEIEEEKKRGKREVQRWI